MNKSQESFTEKTQKSWSKYYHKEISEQEALEIKKNVIKLIELLKTFRKPFDVLKEFGKMELSRSKKRGLKMS